MQFMMGLNFSCCLPSIFLIPLLYRPSNEAHPFGYTQIETVFVVVKGITMLTVTLGLIFNNFHLMLHGGHIVSFQTVASFELFACILGILVTVYLYFKNRSMHSPLITMELQGWKIDSVVSLGMAFAFLFAPFCDFLMVSVCNPLSGQIITITLSVIMLPTPVKTVITGIRDLLLIPPEEETIQDIKMTIEPIIGIYGHKNLYYDILRTGRKIWISVYITFDKDIISLSKFKDLQTQCILALAEKYQDFYFELLPDIEFEESRKISQTLNPVLHLLHLPQNPVPTPSDPSAVSFVFMSLIFTKAQADTKAAPTVLIHNGQNPENIQVNPSAFVTSKETRFIVICRHTAAFREPYFS